jgi:hypothetical protein
MMNDLIRRSDVLAFQNEVEPLMCTSPITGDVFSAIKDADLVEYFNSIPAVDAVPVVHGAWIQMNGHRYCNVCGHKDSPILTKYCPSCGAKMDGGDHDATD